MEKEKNIRYWIESSDRDYKTMLDLFETKNYSWSLFIGHLVLEKLLKALFITKKSINPPLIHDLRGLLNRIGIEIEPEKKVVFDTITRFNISSRYDDYKNDFYHICTKEYTIKWIKEIEEIRQWILNQL